MSDGDKITGQDIKEWAEEHEFDQKDIDNFAATVQIGQLLINTLSEDGLSADSQMEAEAIYEALFEASSIQESADEYPDPLDQYMPKLAMTSSPSRNWD